MHQLFRRRQQHTEPEAPPQFQTGDAVELSFRKGEMRVVVSEAYVDLHAYGCENYTPKWHYQVAEADGSERRICEVYMKEWRKAENRRESNRALYQQAEARA